jgi:hypothetical protein
MWDALAWKNAIEMEIRRLEENRKPILPLKFLQVFLLESS